MSLAKKFIIMLLVSIFIIAIVNVLSFFALYNFFIKIYLSEKISERSDITIEYVNKIIEKQALDDIDSIFTNAEIEFFELLDNSGWKIPLKEQINIDIVVNFLVKSWVWPKYIEEVIPENNLEKIITLLRDPNSPEKRLITRILFGLVVINIFLFIISAFVFRHIIKGFLLPIEDATNQIKKFSPGSQNEVIEYKNKDEVGLLVESINELNHRLSMQEWIRNRLLADISHELKTPITSIQCYLEWIADGVIEMNDTTFDTLTGEMKRLIELVNQIMAFEKFENTALSLTKKSYSAHDIIWQLAKQENVSLKKSNQNISVQWSSNVEILLDKDLFMQLCYNMISNFRKYAGRNTTMEVSVWADKIVFADNGKWIPKSDVLHVSEKFFQWKKEKTGKVSERWIGVGLSIVRKIIHAHWWRYEIESDSGKWFTFTIFFT